MAQPTVTVLGGTGFLGRRVVRRLLAHGLAVQCASRHPERCRTLFGDDCPGLAPIHADVNDDCSLGAAVAGAYGIVNAVSLYVERGGQTFRSVHVEAAGRVARQAREASVERLVHLSGIGANAASDSPYIRSRGDGEAAVRDAFASATVIRPAVMFGPDDAFLRPLSTLLRRLPAFPMFGRGDTELQPSHVDDVAEAIARTLRLRFEPAAAYELGGPRIYRYADLLKEIAGHLGAKPLLVPVPFGLWYALGYATELLPKPPLTRSQSELMQIDSVAAPDVPGFGELQIMPQAVEDVLPQIVSQR